MIDRERDVMRRVIVAITLLATVVASACSRHRPQPTVATVWQDPDPCPATTLAANAPAADDTARIMTALGSQLCKDFHGGVRLFSTLLMCGATHPEPCDAGQVEATEPRLPRVLDLVTKAAAGRLCFPRSCSFDGALVELSLTTPQIFPDSALVSVMAFPRSERTADTKYFDRYIYRVRRMSERAWMVTARYWTGGGHYRLSTP